MLAYFSINDGSTARLVSAIDQCNASHDSENIIVLHGTYVVDRVNNDWYGPNGLPAIACNLRIYGGTIERSTTDGTPAFRLFYVSEGESGLPAGSGEGTNTAIVT